MSLRKTENQVKDLLTETIVTLCRNTLNNYPDVSVEGLLGVTLNKQEIFLVSINQQIDNRKSQSEGLSGLISEIYSAKRKRQQNARSDGESESSDNEANENVELKLEGNDVGGAPGVKRKRRRKRKNFSNSNSPTNFNVISDCTNSNGVPQERSHASLNSEKQHSKNLRDPENQGQSLEALGFAEIQKTSFLSPSNFEQDNADNLDAIDDVLSRELNDASEQLARLNKHQNDEECDSEIPHDITPHSPHHPGVSGVASNQIEPNENDSLGSIHAIANVKIKTEKPDPEDSENEENPSNVIIKVEKRDADGWPSFGDQSSRLANETIDDHGDSDGSLHDGMGEDEAVPSSSNSGADDVYVPRLFYDNASKLPLFRGIENSDQHPSQAPEQPQASQHSQGPDEGNIHPSFMAGAAGFLNPMSHINPMGNPMGSPMGNPMGTLASMGDSLPPMVDPALFARSMIENFSPLLFRGHHLCPFCHKSFAAPNQVRRHLVVHTGEKNYECSICGARFGQKATAKTHRKRIHGLDD